MKVHPVIARLAATLSPEVVAALFSTAAIRAAAAREVDRAAQGLLAQLPAHTGPLVASAAQYRVPGGYRLPPNPYLVPPGPCRMLTVDRLPESSGAAGHPSSHSSGPRRPIMSKVTARFYVAQITEHGNTDHCTVTLAPAYSEGQNKDWAKATPSGKIELSIGADLPAAQFFRDLLRDKDNNVAIEFSVVAKGE